MERRLRIAHRLLSDKGAILVSIDENEQCQLKLLMDDIFGENNFVESIVWNKKSSAKGVPPKNMMVGVHEYILAYQISDKFRFLGEKRDISGFKNPDNDPRGLWRESNIKSTTKPKEEAFTITDPNTGREYTNTWAFSKATLEKMIAEDRILWKQTLPKQKEFLSQMKNENKALKSNWGTFDNQKTTMYLKKLLPNVVFNNPKPIELMKYIVEVVADKKSTILDFFAGSGTTGHAVMQLNKEDGGNRKYILCTNNENNICEEITYERLKNIQEDLPHNLKYLKTGFIPKFSEGSEDSIRSKMMDHIVELIELENLRVMDGKNLAIVFDEDQLDAVISTINDRGIIYHPAEVLFTNEQQAQLQRRDIKIKEIPEYYYATELREVGEL